MLNELMNKTSLKPMAEYSPLALSYIGDAVFELCARSSVFAEAYGSTEQMHKKTLAYVKAVAQAEMYHKVYEHLTEEELAVLKRGRNAKSNSKAKNAAISDYRHATGLESLFGYLYIVGKTDRITELFKICISEGNN